MNLFWDKENSSYTLPPLTGEMIEYAEQQLQVKLPPYYIDLLMEQNGGALLYTAFPTTERNSWAEDHVHIDGIYGIAENEGILQSAYLINEWGLPEKIVLFAGDGHSWFAFDYRETNEHPKVIYIEADDEIDFELAPSFDEFVRVSKLYTHIDAEVEDGTLGFSVKEAIHIFETNQKDSMIQAFNILYYLREDHVPIIEHWVFKLLHHSDLDIRKWAGHYATVFKELNVWTSGQETAIIEILKQDEELKSELINFVNIKV